MAGGACVAGGTCEAGGGDMCSTVSGGDPFSINLPPELAVSHNMAGI